MSDLECLKKMTREFRAYAKKKPENVAIIISNWLFFYQDDFKQRRKVAILADLLGADLLPAVAEQLSNEFNIRGWLVASIDAFSDGIDPEEQIKVMLEVSAWRSLDGGLIVQAKLAESVSALSSAR